VTARPQLRQSPEAAWHGARRRPWAPSLAGAVWLAAGLGLYAEGFAVAVAPRHPGFGLWLLWTAIFVPFAIFVTVLVAARPSQALRQLTVAFVGLYPAVIYRMSSPLILGGFDEHQHERTLLDLLRGGGLFAPNPMLQVSSYYPGMELFTGVAVRLTGMPIMLAMSLVPLLCRLLLVLVIYHGALTVMPSRRGASLVVVFYAASPQFYFFNSQFAYQTMALTLGLGGIFLLRRAQLAEGAAARRLSRLGTLALIATVVTHHATSWIVLAFLIAWAVLSPRGRRKVLARAAAVMGTCVAIWSGPIAGTLAGYVGPVVTAALQQLGALATGSSQHELFTGTAGPATPEWQKAVLIVYALCCTFAAVFCGWVLLSRALRNRHRMLGLLAVLTLAFPITLAAHFVPVAGNLGDRASTFFFFPLALSVSMVITQPPCLARRAMSQPGRAVLVAFVTVLAVIYLGGVMLGGGADWEFLPGPYLVSADPRTQDPETLAAVRWAATHLPGGSRVVADRVPADLLASQARLWPVFVPEHGLEPAWLYFSTTWGSYQTAVVRGLHIRYLYVDQRLANSLPYVGYYVDEGETAQPRRISVADLTKFARVPGLRDVYHDGPVTIYDTAGLRVTSKPEGLVGTHSMGLGTLGDALWGAVMAAVIVALRRRLAWTISAARDVGAAGTGVAVMAVTILIGGVLFGLRLMPGPAFTVGGLLTACVLLVVERRRAGMRLVPRMPCPRGLDPLVVLGVLAGTAGVAIALRAAWATDVAAVDAVLREVIAPGSR